MLSEELVQINFKFIINKKKRRRENKNFLALFISKAQEAFYSIQ
jgi:hypothetical protein